MYKAIIVEDELLVRIGLKTGINWNELGFQLVGEANDGIEALDIIKKNDPDLIILDIKMPKMDGIQLMQKTLEMKKKVKIIIISCVDEFEYVKKALQLGAFDYILKLSMTPQDIHHVLLRVRQKLEEEKKETISEIIRYGFNDFIPLSEIFQDKYTITDLEDKNNIEYFIAFCVNCDEEKFSRSNIDLLRYSIHEVVKSNLKPSVAIDNEGNAIFTIHSKENNMLNKAKILNVCYRISNTLKLCYNIDIDIGCSEISSSIKTVNKLFYQAKKACELLFYENRSKVKIYNPSLDRYNSAKNMSYYIEKLEKILNTGKITDLENYFEILFNERIKLEDMRPYDLKSLIIELLSLIMRRIQLSDEWEFEKSEDNTIFRKLLNCKRISSLRTLISDFIYHILTLKNDNKIHTSTAHIEMITKYINDHYDQPITLKETADYFNLSPSYLSHIFKKETGCHFIEYLNQKRIKKSIELIKNKSLKLYEIASAVGFENVTYFNRLFKRLTNSTPTEYRNTIKMFNK